MLFIEGNAVVLVQSAGGISAPSCSPPAPPYVHGLSFEQLVHICKITPKRSASSHAQMRALSSGAVLTPRRADESFTWPLSRCRRRQPTAGGGCRLLEVPQGCQSAVVYGQSWSP